MHRRYEKQDKYFIDGKHKTAGINERAFFNFRDFQKTRSFKSKLHLI